MIFRFKFIVGLLLMACLVSASLVDRQSSFQKKWIRYRNRTQRINANRLPNASSSYRLTLRPVILIPGTGGTQLYAKLDKPEVVHYYCDKKTDDYFNLWLNLEEIVPLVLSCFLDNIRLVYNANNRTTSNSPGVDIAVREFGNTSSIEYIDPSHIPSTGYFNKLVDALIQFGYRRGFDLRGAPYDFRKGPNEMQEYFENFKELVESNYAENENMASILMCHSMGCVITTDFLKSQSQGWKDKYVKSLITMGAPWGGSIKALKAFTSGDNLGVIVIPSLSIRQVERTFPGLTYLMPRRAFWPENAIIMSEPENNYTVANMDHLFNRLNLSDAYEMYKDMLPYINDFSPPNVELHCLHGVDVPTIDELHYDKSFPDASPKLINGAGDGTVNLNSLKGCLKWTDQQSQPIHYQTFSGVEHMSTMSSKEIIEYILKAIQV